MKICDAGTSYTKIWDLETNEIEVISTSKLLSMPVRFQAGTGHLAKRVTDNYINELMALLHGVDHSQMPDGSVLVDVGSRDLKWVSFKNGHPDQIEWSTGCGVNLGIMSELMCKQYKIDSEELEFIDEKFPVACGLLGVEKVFDEINHGISPAEAVAKFQHGLAKFVFQFARSPEEIYLSGGMCKSKAFVDSLSKYSKVTILGRDVLLKGVYKAIQSKK